MPNGYLQIPDWFSFENQGGSVAVAHLTSAAVQDLVVVAVDHGANQNRGVYRIGRALDDNGVVTGGWTAWIDIPDWFPAQNQGIAVAVADLEGDGALEIVVFMIDDPPGQNQGYYRVGRNLTAAGTGVAWGPWIAVPDWFSWENQHAAIALGDLDNDGHLELLVMTVDNPPEQNRCVYRIGRRLDQNGAVTAGWTPWNDLPEWFSWENHGVGAAMIDIEGTGQLDLVVFNIDGANEQNQAFYRIGRGLDIDGAVVDWTPWLGVPGWFAWENQGGGIAAFRRGGKPAMIVMMVDNPVGQNAGYYRVIPLDHDPARDGAWTQLPFHSDVLAVHAALLPTGKVLFFAGSGSSAIRFAAPQFGDIAQGVPTSVVWDPDAALGAGFFHPDTLRAVDGRPFDFFCGGATFLPDGRLLSAGGTAAYNPFLGRNDVAVLDHVTEQWSFVKPMAHGRWYPTTITLGDGRILAATGLTEALDNPHNLAIEIYAAASNTWQIHNFAGGFPGLPLYAHLFVLADGRIFFNGGRMDDELPVDPCVIDLAHQPLQTIVVPGLPEGAMRNQSASVILPPAQEQRVMIIGGGPAGKPNKTDAIDNVDIVDFRVAPPQFVPASPLNLPRLHLNAVILPDRTVFVTGGSLKQEDQPFARLQPEIYDPASDTWTMMAPSAVPRLYHSTALLLPDGRVVAAGGNPEGGTHVVWDQDPEEEMRLDVFSPPYLFRGPRPAITAAPDQLTYGQQVDITCPTAADIRWVSLVRNGSTTHSFDANQRLVDVPIASRTGNRIVATIPVNPNVAPPGWYMLFVVNDNGVPSVARWVQLL